jgi:hypothetical protein
MAMSDMPGLPTGVRQQGEVVARLRAVIKTKVIAN